MRDKRSSEYCSVKGAGVSELQDEGCSQKGPLPRGDHWHVDRRIMRMSRLALQVAASLLCSCGGRGEDRWEMDAQCPELFGAFGAARTPLATGSLELSLLCSLMGTDYLCAPGEVTLCEPGLCSQNALSAAPGRVGESLLLPSRCQPASSFFPEWKQGNTTGAWGNGRMELWAREQELAQKTRREEATSSSGGPSRKKMLISQTRD